VGDASRKSRKRGFTGEYALTEDDVKALLERCAYPEDKALFTLGINGGIRREDIVSIPLSGIDLEGGWVTFYEQKKKRTWKVPIGPATKVALEAHIHTMPKSRWLFPSPYDPSKHLSGRAAYDRLQKWLARAGLKSRPFHALRSTCVKLCQKRGWTVEQTMRLVGDTWRVISEHYATPTAQEMETVAKERALI